MKYLVRNSTYGKARIVDANSPAEACTAQGWGLKECMVTELPLSSKEKGQADTGEQRPYLVVNKMTADDWKGFASSPEDAATQAGWRLEECNIYDLSQTG